MELRWISRSALDQIKWDACIDQCSWGKIYAKSWYLDFLTDSQWEAIVLDDYDFVMPIAYRRKFGIKYSYRPNFCQQLGVFSINSILDQKVLSLFVNEFIKKYKHLHYPLNHQNMIDTLKEGHWVKRTNLVLNLNQSYEAIFKEYAEDLKRNLKKAQKANLQITENVSNSDLINLYKAAWQSKNQIPESDYVAFGKIIEFGKRNNFSRNIGVLKDGQLLAACFIIKYQKRLYYPFSAISENGRKYGATAFLIDEIIKQHASLDLYLDFEGSDIDSVKFFYQKFNPETESYFQLDKSFPIKELFSSLLGK